MFAISTTFLILSAVATTGWAYQTTPDLGTLKDDDGDRVNYTTPVLTCHANFNVTIEAGDWALIAVEGYELTSGNYGYNGGADRMCVSQTPYGDLNFDVQSDCHGNGGSGTGGSGTMKEFNNTYTWTLRARAEWMVETQQDRLFPMECVYTLTGEAQWESVTKMVTQIFSTEAQVDATRNVEVTGSKIYLVGAEGSGAVDGSRTYTRLQSVTVGQQVRLQIDTTGNDYHSQTPFVGVTGCSFYDKDPSNPTAMEFKLVDEHGCNKPPSYYDPFTAAETPAVNGFFMNHKPVDGWFSAVGLTAATNPGTPKSKSNAGSASTGYLNGLLEDGMAYSDKLKMFKFPGTGEVWAKCYLRFCVEKLDKRCITPNCQGRYYTGKYSNGAFDSIFRRRRRRNADGSTEEEEAGEEADTITEEVITVIAVTSPGSTTKIGVNGPGDTLTLESSLTNDTSVECETKFYTVLAITICLGLALLGILIVYLFKRAAGRISPVDKARFIEDHYGRPTSVGGGGMYGGGMRMNMMSGNGGGLPMISK